MKAQKNCKRTFQTLSEVNPAWGISLDFRSHHTHHYSNAQQRGNPSSAVHSTDGPWMELNPADSLHGKFVYCWLLAGIIATIKKTDVKKPFDIR